MYSVLEVLNGMMLAYLLIWLMIFWFLIIRPYMYLSLVVISKPNFSWAGVCLFFQKGTMWTFCPCIWMLQIQLVCPMGGVDMLSLAWRWLIKCITSTLLEKVNCSV